MHDLRPKVVEETDSQPTWVVFMAKVRNNRSQSKFWMRLQIVFYPHFYEKEDTTLGIIRDT